MWSRALAASILLLSNAVGPHAAEAVRPVSTLDLSGPFATRSPWRLVVTQGPATQDLGGNPAPGALAFCLQPRRGAACASLPPDPPEWNSAHDLFAEPHEVRRLEVVRSGGLSGRPLLFLKTASIHAGDGGQELRTRVLAYRADQDRFVDVFRTRTGSNNNQETRFIASGPMAGDIVSAEPTGDAPYGFWITVHAWSPSGVYGRILRYRSATRYNDGNRLAVIDSEMPGLQRRLGFWRPGAPPPLPAGGCARPRLRRGELWCG